MRKIAFVAILLPCLVLADGIKGIGFLELGQNQTVIQKKLKSDKSELVSAWDKGETTHPSAYPFVYRNIKLTKYFSLPEVSLLFHEKKLYSVDATNYPNPAADNMVWLVGKFKNVYDFQNVIDGLKEKYTFSEKEKTDKLEKADGGCYVDLWVKKTTWIIESEGHIDATYTEQRVFDPVTKKEINSDNLDWDMCHVPYDRLQITDKQVLAEVEKIQANESEAQEAERLRKRQNILKDL